MIFETVLTPRGRVHPDRSHGRPVARHHRNLARVWSYGDRYRVGMSTVVGPSETLSAPFLEKR